MVCWLSAAPAASFSGEVAARIDSEVLRLAAERDLWPGFDPRMIPLAVYDGQRTYLFRHPSPPEGFASGSSGALEFEGRHAAVTANSSAEIGGVSTATLIAESGEEDRSASEWAAVALHEAFHVYQRAKHPDWHGNEGDLFLYPTEDARLLAWRRMETEALRRALSKPDGAASACWTRLALGVRRERFSAMDAPFAAYERKNELNEGLAAYIQLKALGKTPELPAGGFDATQVRQRIYLTGPALAFLLDRFDSGWRASLESDDRQFLEGLLESALGDPAVSKPSCSFSDQETAAIEETARRDAGAVAQGRIDRRKEFDARPGFRVVIEAAQGDPLWPQGFDPLQIERVEGGLLHLRFLRLGNDSGRIEVLGSEGVDVRAFTEAVGSHPLFTGVGRAVVWLPSKPEVREEGGRVELQTPGLTLALENASVIEGPSRLRIVLAATR